MRRVISTERATWLALHPAGHQFHCFARWFEWLDETVWRWNWRVKLLGTRRFCSTFQRDDEAFARM